MSSPHMTFGTRLIGQTEKALSAILESLLSGTDVTPQQWIALNVTLSQSVVPASEAADHIAAALKASDPEGRMVLQGLVDRGLVYGADDGTVGVTPEGRQFHERVQTRVATITDRLWGDIPVADLQVAGAVLRTALHRATEELSVLIADGSPGMQGHPRPAH